MKTKCRRWRAIVNNGASQFINKLALLLVEFIVDGQMQFARATFMAKSASEHMVQSNFLWNYEGHL